MIEPYRTMFDGFEDHWMLGVYLDPGQEEPDWLGIGTDDRLECLSHGEKVLIDFAAAYANVRKHLDDGLQWRIGLALRRALDGSTNTDRFVR